MSKFKFNIQYKDQYGQEKKRIVEVEEPSNDLDRAKALAEYSVKGILADRDPYSFEQVSVVEVFTIEEIKSDL